MSIIIMFFFFFFFHLGSGSQLGCEERKDCPSCIQLCYWTLQRGGFPALCLANPDHSPYPVFFAISPYGDCSQYPGGKKEAAASTGPLGGYTSVELGLVAVLCLLLGGFLVWGSQRAWRRWQLWQVAGVLQQEVDVVPMNHFQQREDNQVRQLAQLVMPNLEEQQQPRALQILREEVRNNPNLVPRAEPPRPANLNPFAHPEALAIDMLEVGLMAQPAEDRVAALPDLGTGRGSLRSKAKKRTQYELLLEARENSIHSGEILGVRLRSQAH